MQNRVGSRKEILQPRWGNEANEACFKACSCQYVRYPAAAAMLQDKKNGASNSN